ncbi:potassium channel family protein [uncultured Erythrobacter sp.]|uniref:potassium channel family protein n=1 Tax=uncultured Erythrobacter sp. TaxID=263913 RepID=UPI00260D3C9D|nr:potassium channel family protein [uncultured Erythrobacter sp.]
MISIALAALLIAATIFIHYETLRLVSLGATDLNVRPRMRMWMMLSGALLSHLVHIALYAVGFILMEFEFGLGTIAGPDSGIYNDAFYFSITSYTTLGIGDIYPTGQVRLLSGIEALNGLVMVTWTASMTYLHMERYWKTGLPG